MEPPLHVFLSHNSQDKPVVPEIWKSSDREGCGRGSTRRT